MTQSALPYLALGAAAALTFAGYTQSQSAAYYAAQGQIQNLSDCSSFSLASYGDPHLTGQVANNSIGASTTSADASNLTTIANTSQGATQVSTTSESSHAGYQDVNGTVAVQHSGSGANAWTLQTSESNGVVQATLTDSTGTHTFTSNSTGTTFSEPDGTKIVVTQAPAQIAGLGTVNVPGVHVLQGLNAGGTIDTSIIANNTFTPGWAGLSVVTQGRGNAVINGTTATLATGADSADLPCIQPNPQSTGKPGGSNSAAANAQSLQ